MNEVSVAVAIAAVVAVGIVFVRVVEIERRLAALRRIEAKLDALLAHAGIEFNLYGNVPRDVIEAVERGEKIEAIKRYRAATGADLREAKEFVEDLQRERMRGT
jgi:ribosomal protein L7/L12